VWLSLQFALLRQMLCHMVARHMLRHIVAACQTMVCASPMIALHNQQ
jgi:hypothetical protein